METRILPLEGVLNFRDFGGYEGANGRKIVLRTLFRSAQFGEASPEDMAQLDALNIKVQADLRRPDERERQGHRWPVKDVQVVLSEKGQPSEAPHVKFLSEVSVSPQQAENWMVEYYVSAPYREALFEPFRDWFKALLNLEEGQSAVVNCTAGKDRTGMLCALTHYALGVDREIIFQDYALTNEAVDLENRLPKMAAMFNKSTSQDYDMDVYRPFIGVRDIYLEAALESMEKRSGSVETYLAEMLGIGPKEIDTLRARYLA